MYDDSCNLFSTSKIESYYKYLIDTYKNRSNVNFNLIHLLQGNILSLLHEDVYSSNSTILIDKKTYPECESKPTAFFFTEELHCSDELQEFTDNYVFDNLFPATSYQFKIEVASAFGKSDPFVTDAIEVPFPLNSIVEKNEMRNNDTFTSLECSTTLLDTRRLQFKWYYNEKLISSNDSNYEQIMHKPLNENEGAVFSIELIFKQDPKELHGLYTCSLIFTDELFSVARNQTYIFRTKGKL
jgi:hypothetical protein